MEQTNNPTYEELTQAYMMLLNENQQVKAELNSIKNDKSLDKLKFLVETIIKFNDLKGANFSCYNEIVTNAAWHLNKMLEIPKE